MGTYLEEFLDSIYTLPSEIKRGFDLMRELDKASNTLVDEMKTLQKDYLIQSKKRVRDRYDAGGTQPTEEELKELVNDEKALEDITSIRQRAVQKLDEKVAIATQTYDLVDHHIRRLDNDLSKFEATLRMNGEFENEKTIKKKKVTQPVTTPGPKRQTQQTNTSGRKRTEANTNSGGTVAVPESEQVVTTALVLDDLPIDPNEPVYCSCRRVSYGQMVGCDNDDCKYEWFHFDCVGLTEQPQGKWYCKECTDLGFK